MGAGALDSRPRFWYAESQHCDMPGRETHEKGGGVDFYQVVDQVIELLRHRGRVSYRALQRQFGLDDAYLEDLKAELIVAQCLAVDEHGQVLVWTGGATSTLPLQAVSATPSDTPLKPEAEHGDSSGIRL